MFDLDKLVNDYLMPFGLKIVMAVVIWIVGGVTPNRRCASPCALR